MLQQEGDSFWQCCVLMCVDAPHVHTVFSFCSSGWMFELWSDVCAEFDTKMLFFSHLMLKVYIFSEPTEASLQAWSVQHGVTLDVSDAAAGSDTRGKVFLVPLQLQFLKRCWFSMSESAAVRSWWRWVINDTVSLKTTVHVLLLSQQWFVFV